MLISPHNNDRSCTIIQDGIIIVLSWQATLARKDNKQMDAIK